MVVERDPLPAATDKLHNALDRPGQASAAVASVEVDADGTLRAIRLSDRGRRLDPDTLAATIVRLHAEAMTAARQRIAAAVTALENDPRLRAERVRIADTLTGPVPTSPLPGDATPQPHQSVPPVPTSQPTRHTSTTTHRNEVRPTDLHDDEATYFRRSTWLEY